MRNLELLVFTKRVASAFDSLSVFGTRNRMYGLCFVIPTNMLRTLTYNVKRILCGYELELCGQVGFEIFFLPTPLT